MNDEIRVLVKSNGGGRCLAMYYVDPVSGKRVVKSTGTTNEKKAVGAAAVWQDELNTGRYASPNRLKWLNFGNDWKVRS